MTNIKYKIFLILSLCFLCNTCCLSGKEPLSKEASKNYKKVCKQLKQDGWKVFGKEQSLDEAMMQYYLQMETDADSIQQQVVGMGQDKNINIAYSQAKHRATVANATHKGVIIEAFSEMIMSSSSGCSSRFETTAHTKQIIRSATPVLSLYRTLSDGTTEINLYYFIY